MVSVIIPCYNSQHTIIKSVRSVLGQSYENFELIVIDDGSTDDSVQVLTRFLEKERPKQPFLVVSQLNQGPSVARNKGIDLAKGEWIAFLDADDCWEPEKLSIQRKVAEASSDIALVGATSFEKQLFAKSIHTTEITLNKLLYRNYFSTSAVMVKKTILNKNKFNIHQKYSEDYRLWLTISAQYKCIYINKQLSKSVLNKSAAITAGGLSSNLWEMEKGELSNYKYLYRKGHINLIHFFSCSSVSLLKYFSRCFINH